MYKKLEEEKERKRKEFELSLKNERTEVLKAARAKAKEEAMIRKEEELMEARAVEESIKADAAEQKRKQVELKKEMKVKDGYCVCVIYIIFVSKYVSGKDI